jgi:hypothetical protein
MIFSGVMSPEPHRVIDQDVLKSPRIYTAADVMRLKEEFSVTIGGVARLTSVILPIDLCGEAQSLPVVPVLKPDGGVEWIAYLNPKDNPLSGLCSRELGERLIPNLSERKVNMHRAFSNKSDEMTKHAGELVESLKARKINQYTFSPVESERKVEEINKTEGAGIAVWYYPITAPKGKGMALDQDQVERIQESPIDSHFLVDDVVSTGATSEAVAWCLQEAYRRVGKQFTRRDLTTVAVAVEVPDVKIESFVPDPTVIASILIPVITTPVVRTHYVSELDLSAASRFVS